MFSGLAEGTLDLGAVTVALGVQVGNAPPRVTRMHVEVKGDEGAIDATLLRELAQEIEAMGDAVAKAAITSEFTIDLGAGTLQLNGSDGATVQLSEARLVPAVDSMADEWKRQRRIHRTDDDYQRVAQVYLDAAGTTGLVREAVAREFHVGKDRASQLIAEARRRGLLPPTDRKKGSRK